MKKAMTGVITALAAAVILVLGSLVTVDSVIAIPAKASADFASSPATKLIGNSKP
jgi:hypothetical protein